MEKASEQLSKLTMSSESEESLTASISKPYIELRHKNKLKDSKDICTSDLNPDEKAAKLYKLLVAQVESTKKLEIEANSIRKRISNNQREKETLMSDINQHRDHRLRVENFCREIRDKNNSILKECKEIEDAEKRKLEEINDKMNKTVQEINEKFVENETDKNKLMEENKTLLAQMEELRTQALSRDEEFQKMIMEKTLEVQMLKVQVEYKDGFEGPQLRTQVDLYKNKFGEFQSIIEKSQEAYGMADVEVKKLNDKIAEEQKLNTDLKQSKSRMDIEYITLFTEKNELLSRVNGLKDSLVAVKAQCGKLLQAKKK